MATGSARRPVKKAAQSTKRRVAVPKPAPAPQVEEAEVEEVEAEEVEDVNDEDTQEVPESIKQLAEDALAAAEDEDDDLENMPVLTIEQIRDAKDRTTQWLPVKEWGGKMQIKSLSAKAMFDMMGDDNAGITESGFTMDLSMVSMQKAIIQNGVVQPVITDAGFEILMEKSTGPVMHVLQSIMRISKLGKGEDGKDPVEQEVTTFRPTGE